MTKILIKRGQAEANLPTLDPGEPAITFDSGGKLWIGTPSGNLEITGGGSGSPGGSDTQVQFNDGGVFGGSANLTWDGIANQLLVGGATAAASDSPLEVHGSVADMRLNVVNDSASADENFASVGFYLKNAAEEFASYAFWTAGSIDRTDGSEDGYLSVALIRGGLVTNTAYFGTSQTYFNYNSDDIDTIIYGSSDLFTACVDAGENAFQVGIVTPGNIADFRSTGIVFNNSESDRDFRIAGNGTTNAYVYDGGNNRHGFGTGTPSVTMEIVSGALSGTNLAPQIKLGVGAGEYQGFYSTVANVFGMIGGAENDGTNWVARHTSATLLTMAAIDGSIRFYTNTGLTAGNNFTPSERMRIYSNGNVSIEGVAGSLIVSRMTSTQRDALTAINGMVLYNTTTNKLQVRASGSWVDLH